MKIFGWFRDLPTVYKGGIVRNEDVQDIRIVGRRGDVRVEYMDEQGSCAMNKTEEELQKQIDALRRRVESQARQITIKDEALHERNAELDAMHWVWCDGGCATGTHRYDHSTEITEEIVLNAEGNAKRLRTWWVNKLYRAERHKQEGLKG